MAVGIKFQVEPVKDINPRLNDYVLQQLVKIIKPQEITRIIQARFADAVKAHPTWDALLTGRTAGVDDLRADFGIRKGSEQARLDTILQAMMDSITVDVVPKSYKQSIRIRLPVKGIDADFKKISQLGAAITISRGITIPWFEWLVLRGDETVIEGAEILYSPSFQGSRSGFAVMQIRRGAKFSTSPGFGGTRASNFVTEAIQTMTTNVGMFVEIEQVVLRWFQQVK